jgi:hypothetical protein
MALNNCILWNQFESSNPTSKIGHGMTDIGSPTFPSAKFGNGVYVNAANEGVKGTTNDAGFSTQKGIVEFWMKPDFNVVNGVADNGGTTKNVPYDIINTPTNNTRFLIWFRPASGTWVQLAGPSGTLTFISTSATLDMTAGTLYHFMAVWNNGTIGASSDTLRIYLDGVDVDSSTSTAFATHSLNGFTNTICTDAVNETWQGNMVVDNIKHYNDCTEHLINEILWNRTSEAWNVDDSIT